MDEYYDIEDMSPKKIIDLIIHENDFKFKHMDCRMVFSSDGKYLYAEDVQNPLIDCFADGDFLQAIKDYYVISSVVVKLMESLASEGMVLDLSDANGEQTLSLDELKRQVKNQIASQI